jgi:FkbM family methyltransferase
MDRDHENFSYDDKQLASLVSEFTSPAAREAVELAALPEILSGCQYFIDVGANVGQYTFHASKCLVQAKILSIEANPYLIPALTRTVETLRTRDDRGNDYEIVAAAVSDVVGSLDFFVSRFPTLSSVFPQDAKECVIVPTVRLDDFRRDSVFAVIKIDIEGAEYRAIRSGSQFVDSPNTKFFVELHGWGDRSIQKYPVHVCWFFLRKRYAVRKIGTHYLFFRAGWQKCVASFLVQWPYLAFKYLVFRFGGNLGHRLSQMRSRLSAR